MKDVVQKAVENHNCVGCGLCTQFFKNCYGMQLTKEGFYRPKKLRTFDRDKDKEEIFRNICPAYIRNDDNNTNLGIWGKYEKILTTYSSDKDIRFKASTGGSLTGVLLYLIENKIVDGVIQVKSNARNPYIAQYGLSTTKDEIISSMGSKYEPTFMFSNLNTILNFNGKLVVVGKPCDISILKRYISQHKIKSNIYCYITFLCGGLPSLNATLNILENNGIDKKSVTELRYRGYGWPGFFCVKSGNKQLVKISYVDSWARNLSKKIQGSCEICTEGVGETADIVFGDAWNLNEKGRPVLDESDGVNITIARTKLGLKIIEDSIKAKYLTVKDDELAEEYLNKMQPYQAKHRQEVYYKIIKKKLNMKKIPKFAKNRFHNYSKNIGIMRKLKIILISIKKEIKNMEK